MRADACRELIGEVLRRRLHRLVTRPAAIDVDRGAGADDEARRPDAFHERWHERRAGHEAHERGRALKEGAPPEELHLDAIATDVAIHQERDDAVGGEAAPDLERGVK